MKINLEPMLICPAPGAHGLWKRVISQLLPEVEGADPRALRFKENDTADGIELRLDADVLAAPQG
jgi:hypothetical protein